MTKHKAWTYEHDYHQGSGQDLNNTYKSHAHAAPGVGNATNPGCLFRIVQILMIRISAKLRYMSIEASTAPLQR
jgi:hypothetical protein